MGRIRQLWQRLRRDGGLIAALLLAALMLGYDLSTIPVRGLVSQPEATAIAQASSLHQLMQSPLFWPLSALRYLSLKLLPGHEILAARIPSLLLALLGLACCLYIIRRWYGVRTAFFGYVVLVSSAWLLHVGRLATNDVAYWVALPLLLTAHIWLHGRRSTMASFVWLTISVGLLYIPGLVWFVLLQVIWQRKLVGETFKATKHWSAQLLIVVVTTLETIPLVYGFVRHFNLDLVLGWLGLPTALPSVTEIAKNAAAAVLFVFARTPPDPVRWLGRLPLLGAFMLLCLVAGSLFYVQHFRAERSRLLLALTGLSVVLLAAGGPVTRSILVPLVYIVAIGGIAYVLHLWLQVFPRNPLARRVGIGVVAVALALTVGYNLRQYYVAWRHAPETRAAFTTEPPQV